MPAATETTLAKLRRDYEAAKAQIQALGYVLPGTVQRRLYRCGKPNCRCMTEGILHGPYYQWTRKVSGKTVNINLDFVSAKKVRECRDQIRAAIQDRSCRTRPLRSGAGVRALNQPRDVVPLRFAVHGDQQLRPHP